MADTKLTNLDHLKLLAEKAKAETDKLRSEINGKGYQTAQQVAAAIAAADHMSRKIVSSVEQIKTEIQENADAAAKTIYMVPKAEDGAEDNAYDEYMVVDGKPEKVGSTNIDMSGYVQKNGDDRLMTTTEAAKLAGIQENATRVEQGDENGEVKINGQAVKVYELPGTVLQTTDIADDGDVEEMLDGIFEGKA